jgi:diadenosine tetraphosphatase ApaH/serine/threonine PP2A family protein phosphatase
VERWLLKIQEGVLLTEAELRHLTAHCRDILLEESNVVMLEAPIKIIGDIHGQFHDLLVMLKAGGDPATTKYCFLGDYVDRGYYSVETMTLLLALKAMYPENITLLRGNHESRQISNVYGFYDEVVKKYGNVNAWKYFTEVFDCMGIAAIVEGQVLCVHGGLSPLVRSVDQIRWIERRGEIPPESSFSDLLWSDPDNVEQWQMSPRGAGWVFGPTETSEFLHLNGLSLIARAHQLVMEGY